MQCPAPPMAAAISASSESIRPAAASSYLQAALALAFATWLEIASIKGGDRQSYGSSPSSFSRALIPSISPG